MAPRQGAAATIVSPEIATARNSPPAGPSEAVSSATWCWSCSSPHPCGGLTNTSTAPCDSSPPTSRAATATAGDRVAGDRHRAAEEIADRGVRLGGGELRPGLGLVDGPTVPAPLTKTYATPWATLIPPLSLAAPTTTVFPEVATEAPNSEPSCALDAVSSDVWVASVQPPLGIWKHRRLPQSSAACRRW